RGSGVDAAQPVGFREESPPPNAPCTRAGAGRFAGGRRRGHPSLPGYLSSTEAPAPSSLLLMSSASSFDAASLTVLGAPSTSSLASLRPRPVMARTSLMTAILLPPAAVRTTSNSVFSSAAAAAPSPPAGPATTAAAAAGSMPYSSLRTVRSSLASLMVRFTRLSARALMSAMVGGGSCGGLGASGPGVAVRRYAAD